MPGAGFKRDAAKVKVSTEEAHVKPFKMVQRAIVRPDVSCFDDVALSPILIARQPEWPNHR